MKIVTKIILLVTTTVILVVGGIGVLVTHQTNELVYDQIERVSATNLSFATAEILKTSQDIQRTAEVIARNRDIRKALSRNSSRGVNQILNDLIVVYPYYSYIMVVDLDNVVFAASTRDNRGKKILGEQLLNLDVRKNPMYTKGSLTETTIGNPNHDPYIELIGGKESIGQWFITPVRKRGKLKGWIVLHYDWKRELTALLMRTIDHLNAIGHPTREALLVDQDNIVVVGEHAAGKFFSPTENMIWKNSDISFGATKMKMIVVDDRNEINRPLANAQFFLSLIFVLCVVLLVAVLYVVLRQTLLNRLLVLYNGVEEMNGSDLGFRFPKIGHDEVGALASSLNRMTERLQSTTVSREQLGESEERIRTVLEFVDYGILFLDPDLKVRVMNPAYKLMWGIKEGIAASDPGVEDLIRYNQGKGFYDVTDEDFDEFVRSRTENIRRGDVAPTIVRQQNGRILRYQCIALPDGRRMLTYFDITASTTMEEKTKQSEARARAAEEQLSYVFENMTEGLVFYDADQRLVFCNSKYREFYNYDEDDTCPGTRFEDLVKLDQERGTVAADATHHLRRIDFRQRNKGTLEIELSDGRWLLIRETTLAEGTISIATDITARKQAEAEIEGQRAQLDNILKSIHQGIVLFDCERRLVACNTAYPEILNMENSFLKPGVPLLDIAMTIAKRGDYGEGDPEELAHGRVDALWQSYHHSDISFGGERSFDIQSTRTEDDGLVIAYTDITERKKAERIIADAMHLIHESIQYASRIQRSVLPDPKVLDDVFADFLVIWEPKDVVGGDVYLYRKCGRGHLLILIDCTGHGVPGAFMTMIATGAFDQALIEIPSGDPAAILTRVNQLVKAVLGQDSTEGESDDGFECGLCLIDETAKMITYAGARFELWCVKGEEFIVVKGNKVGIGYRRTDMVCAFDNHIMPIEKGVSYYITSDGLVDQIGGEKRRAFGKRRLKGLILDYSRMKMANQGVHILRAFEEHQHKEVRRDDISMVGFKPHL